jgi:ferric-dicitrate binding protein FerR (iron transport regulator)
MRKGATVKDAPELDGGLEELVAAQVAGDLEPAQRRRAEQLLATSAPARALAARLRALHHVTIGWSSAGLDAEGRARVGARLELAARAMRRRRWALGGAGVAAALALLLVLGWPLLRDGPRPGMDLVQTGAGQYRLLEIGDRAVAFVGENAELERRSTTPVLFVRRGAVRLVVKSNRQAPFVVGSPAAEVVVLGTEFDVTVRDQSTEVRVTRGEVELRNRHGRRRVWPGELARVKVDESPRFVERLKGIVLDLPPEIEPGPSPPSPRPVPAIGRASTKTPGPIGRGTDGGLLDPLRGLRLGR